MSEDSAAFAVCGNLGAGKTWMARKMLIRAALNGITVERTELGVTFIAPEGMSEAEMNRILYG